MKNLSTKIYYIEYLEYEEMKSYTIKANSIEDAIDFVNIYFKMCRKKNWEIISIKLIRQRK